jgi:uncharacterized protein
MEIEWDEEKDRQNRAKHGVGLRDAAAMDWVVGKTTRDSRRDYGEIRLIRYAMISSRLYVCVFTMRGSQLRIISLRKANKRERVDHGIQIRSSADE